MRFVFFGNASTKNAAIRYRVLAFAERLRAEGHHVTICLPAPGTLRESLWEGHSKPRKLLYFAIVLLTRAAQLRHVVGADAVLFRGPVFDYGPPVFERIIRLLCPRLVFDIDDAIWEPPAHVDSPFLRLVDFGWVRKMCGLCRHAIVGNAHLRDYVATYLDPAQVTIIPTCIEMARHTAKPERPPGGPILLGWTGLSDNLGYLDQIAPVLRRLAARHDIQLVIASGRDYQLEGVPVVNRRWRIEDEIDYLQQPDIGLMPLTDTPRARGKCAFKALQYMGVATPCVLSPVGMNTDVIQDGENGFLAATEAEWEDKLERLIVDSALRGRLGAAARKTVAERYAHDVHYPAFRAALLRLAAPPEMFEEQPPNG